MSKKIKLKNNDLLTQESISIEEIGDCNSIPFNEQKLFHVHSISPRDTNSPLGGDGSNGVIMSYVPHQSYIYQFAITGTNPVRLFTRTKYQDIWHSWKEIPDSNKIANIENSLARRRLEVIWSGSQPCSAVGNWISVGTSQATYNFDILLVEVQIGSSVEERATLILYPEYGTRVGSSVYLFILSGYRVSLIADCNGYSAVGLCIKELGGWAPDQIKLVKIRGLKIN